MYVVKRDGSKEPVSTCIFQSIGEYLQVVHQVQFDKITTRIERLCDMEPKLSPDAVDPVIIAQKVVSGVFPGVKTAELDNLAAETAAYMSTINVGYGDLAARIAISNLQVPHHQGYILT